jgi:hypothetical protein
MLTWLLHLWVKVCQCCRLGSWPLCNEDPLWFGGLYPAPLLSISAAWGKMKELLCGLQRSFKYSCTLHIFNAYWWSYHWEYSYFWEIFAHHSHVMFYDLRFKTVLAYSLMDLFGDVNLFLNKYLHKVPRGCWWGTLQRSSQYHCTRYFWCNKKH